MSRYEGNFFKERDFYDWGIDYEIIKLKEKYNLEIDTLKFYRNNFAQNTSFGAVDFNKIGEIEKEILNVYLENATVEDLDTIIHTHREDLQDKYIWMKKIIELENKLNDRDAFMETILAREYIKYMNIHNNMCFINLYTIIDEYLSDLIKALGMYCSNFFDDVEIKISYNKLEDFDSKVDLKEHFIDTAMFSDKNLSGVVSKIKFLLKHINLSKEFKKLDSVKLLSEERNCIIHNKGLFNKKAIKNIGIDYAERFNITEHSKVIMNSKKMDDYIVIIEYIVDFFTSKIEEKYFNYIEIDLDNEKNVD